MADDSKSQKKNNDDLSDALWFRALLNQRFNAPDNAPRQNPLLTPDADANSGSALPGLSSNFNPHSNYSEGPGVGGFRHSFSHTVVGLTQYYANEAENNSGHRTHYDFGDKNINSGGIDCSGWVGFCMKSALA